MGNKSQCDVQGSQVHFIPTERCSLKAFGVCLLMQTIIQNRLVSLALGNVNDERDFLEKLLQHILYLSRNKF